MELHFQGIQPRPRGLIRGVQHAPRLEVLQLDLREQQLGNSLRPRDSKMIVLDPVNMERVFLPRCLQESSGVEPETGEKGRDLGFNT